MLLQIGLGLLPAAPPPVPQGRVHIVDYLGVQGYVSAQAAVDDAQSGDTVVLIPVPGQPYLQPGFAIQGKSLTVVGKSSSGEDPDAQVRFIDVLDLPEGGKVVLRDLKALGRSAPFQSQPALSGLRVTDCQGAVRVESCVFGTPIDGSSITGSRAAVRLDRALDVSLQGCEVWGTSAGGLSVSESRVAVYSSSLVGGFGPAGFSYTVAEADDGYPALDLTNRSFAWLGGTTVTGGAGGWADCIHGVSCMVLPGDGGVGAVIEPGSLCVALETQIAGGAAGHYPSTNSGVVVGVPGLPSIGQITQVSGEQRRLHGPRATRSGRAVNLGFTGTPGEEVVLQVARKGGHRFLGPLFGVLLVNDGFVGGPEVLGVVPASGRLEIEYELPTVWANGAGLFSLQAIFRTSPTRFRLSNVVEISVMGEGTPLLERPARLYVNGAAAAGGDGLSWATACNNLADALDTLPVSFDIAAEVWLAEGTYRCAPSHLPNARDKYEFYGPVRLLGGFSGDENEADERDPVAHPVIITGDLAGDDNAPGGSTSENSFGLLDINNVDSQLSVLVSGIDWTGSWGVSALSIGGSAVVDRCRFQDNYATLAASSSLSLGLGTHPLQTSEVRFCQFIGNSGWRGGAVHANTYGLSDGPLPPGATRFAFLGCSFVGNTARASQDIPGLGLVGGGGAIYVVGTPGPVTISSCTFADNDFTGQPATVALPLAGVYMERDFEVTFANNLCRSEHLSAGLNPWFSSIGTGHGDVAEFNRVDWLPADWGAATNTTADPIFEDANGPDGVPGSGDENLRLAPGSPCIDAGNSNLVPAGIVVDLDGNTRFVNDPSAPDVGVGGTRIVDMGAYERQ